MQNGALRYLRVCPAMYHALKERDHLLHGHHCVSGRGHICRPGAGSWEALSATFSIGPGAGTPRFSVTLGIPPRSPTMRAPSLRVVVAPVGAGTTSGAAAVRHGVAVLSATCG